MTQRSAEIKACLAKFKFDTEVRVQSVKDFLRELKNEKSIDDFVKSVLDQSLSTLEDEYEKYENYWWDLENEINCDDDYDELSDEVLETMSHVNRVKDEASDLLDNLERLANANAAAVETEPPSPSMIDDDSQDDLENAMKVLEMNLGIVNPNLKGQKRGGEVNVPLPSEPKLKVLIFEVECDPVKHFKVMGGSLITNSKCRRHRITGLRTHSKSMETKSFMPHRWIQYHRWPPPVFRSFDVTRSSIKTLGR